VEVFRQQGAPFRTLPGGVSALSCGATIPRAVVTCPRASSRLGRALASRGCEDGGDPGTFRPMSTIHEIFCQRRAPHVSVYSKPPFPTAAWERSVSRRSLAGAFHRSARGVVFRERPERALPLASLPRVALQTYVASCAPAYARSVERRSGAPRERSLRSSSAHDAFHPVPTSRRRPTDRPVSGALASDEALTRR
jgi:hypothetical protein